MEPTLDFVIAGAQKGGSTQLAAHLSCVSGVWLPKEEDAAFESPYFETGSVDRLRFEIQAGGRGYLRHGIKRPSYLGIKIVPQRIQDEFPEARIILVLRDPVDRAVSAYLHKARYGRIGLLPVDLAMSRILEGDDLGSPRTYETLAWSQYGALLPRWESIFGDRLMVLGSGDLRESGERAVRSVIEKLGLAYSLDRVPPSESNVGATTMLEMRLHRQMHVAINELNPMTRQLMPRTTNPARLAYGGMARRLARAVHSRVDGRDPRLELSSEVRARLEAFFAPDYGYVAEKYDVKL